MEDDVVCMRYIEQPQSKHWNALGLKLNLKKIKYIPISYRVILYYFSPRLIRFSPSLLYNFFSSSFFLWGFIYLSPPPPPYTIFITDLKSENLNELWIRSKIDNVRNIRKNCIRVRPYKKKPRSGSETWSCLFLLNVYMKKNSSFAE